MSSISDGNEEPCGDAPLGGAALWTDSAAAVESAVSARQLPDTMAQIEQHRNRVLRKPPPAIFGAIDVGTNSIHLVMAEISPEGDFRILGSDKELVQLGRGGFERHTLTQRAMNDGIAALTRFTKMARLKGVTRLWSAATSAVREARNGGEFVQRVRDELGLDLHVITPEEEARLIYLAVRHAVDLGGADHLILDVGGGSVEVVLGNAARAEVLCSAKLGSARMAELFLRSDPPDLGEIRALRRHVERHLQALAAKIDRRGFQRAVVTSGTAECIAAICVQRRGGRAPDPFTGVRLDRGELKALFAELSRMDRAERLRVPKMDAGRVDGIVPGCLVLLAMMRLFEIEELEYCDMGLREGMILDYIGKHRAHLLARATWPDPRLRSVIQLAERCAYRRTHAEQVAKLALSLFDQLEGLHGLDRPYRELLMYGCLLHDIGYLISHEGHHKHSYYLIRNGRLQGFSDQEIEIIANLARYHRKGRPKKSDFSYEHLAKEHRPPVRKLIPLLRLANALDRTHYSVVQSLLCKVTEGGVELEIQARQDAELELWTARRQGRFFEDSFELPLSITLKATDDRDAEHADSDERTAPEAARLSGTADYRGGD